MIWEHLRKEQTKNNNNKLEISITELIMDIHSQGRNSKFFHQKHINYIFQVVSEILKD